MIYFILLVHSVYEKGQSELENSLGKILIIVLFFFWKCEIRLKTEALLREQLTQDVKQLTSLIDALTSVSLIH